ncbi:MAG: hypothetical protein ACP5DX_16185 [Paracoccaceae bacterium]
MFFELIATIVAGVGAAGLVLAVNRLTGGRLPRWAMPVAAGGAMIAFTVWSEYSWFARTRAALPEGVTVASTVETRGGLRVWTYAFPYVSRFSAIDRRSLRTHPDLPGQRILHVLLFARWSPPSQLPVLFDCEGHRRADLGPATRFGEGGRVIDPDWRALEAGDPLLRAACAEGGDG